ncbi:MAG: hypothetical protein JXC36_07285 [Candidatus Atribacteria bacterium]|nr:hypothetical protein [Candidatus Atribacteria bacterium]
MVKKYAWILIIGLIVIFISCHPRQINLTNEQIVANYYKGLNDGDFSLIINLVSDSIQTTEKEYIITRSRKELYQQFKWDSVFNPKYELIDLKADSNSIEATVSKTCKRIEFLQDTSLIIKVMIDLKNGQMTKIQIIDYVYINFAKWQPRRDSLVVWIDKKHPELSGFLNDFTIKGAENYLKAIEFYKNEK